MITSQFCVNGCAKQSDIIRAFGVTSISVKRSVKTYRYCPGCLNNSGKTKGFCQG
jgi:hypothetical protein